ncbi:hypothetical protein ANANG_G00170930 [Anguilla anguilla]|uniref:Uncharacterized protein n=1 Tax=Anguilla anguilla TaxID=7936 RepID=A0A9D3RSW8_ANGAN|nr:hypothetical protein ANANG_G00170930 [Anguilla anguilla]
MFLPLFPVVAERDKAKLSLQAKRLCPPSSTAWFCFERQDLHLLNKVQSLRRSSQSTSPGQRVSCHLAFSCSPSDLKTWTWPFGHPRKQL